MWIIHNWERFVAILRNLCAHIEWNNARLWQMNEWMSHVLPLWPCTGSWSRLRHPLDIITIRRAGGAAGWGVGNDYNYKMRRQWLNEERQLAAVSALNAFVWIGFVCLVGETWVAWGCCILLYVSRDWAICLPLFVSQINYNDNVCEARGRRVVAH